MSAWGFAIIGKCLLESFRASSNPPWVGAERDKARDAADWSQRRLFVRWALFGRRESAAGADSRTFASPLRGAPAHCSQRYTHSAIDNEHLSGDVVRAG